MARKVLHPVKDAPKHLIRKALKKHKARKRYARKQDEAREARVPKYIETWLRHPDKYDLPGVDMPAPRSKKDKALELFYRSIKARYGKGAEKVFEEIERKHKTIRSRVKALIKAMATDYSLTMNSRLMRLAADWAERVEDNPRLLLDAVLDLASYLELRDLAAKAELTREQAHALKAAEDRERLERMLGLERRVTLVLDKQTRRLLKRMAKNFDRAVLRGTTLEALNNEKTALIRVRLSPEVYMGPEHLDTPVELPLADLAGHLDRIEKIEIQLDGRSGGTFKGKLVLDNGETLEFWPEKAEPLPNPRPGTPKLVVRLEEPELAAAPLKAQSTTFVKTGKKAPHVILNTGYDNIYIRLPKSWVEEDEEAAANYDNSVIVDALSLHDSKSGYRITIHDTGIGKLEYSTALGKVEAWIAPKLDEVEPDKPGEVKIPKHGVARVPRPEIPVTLLGNIDSEKEILDKDGVLYLTDMYGPPYFAARLPLSPELAPPRLLEGYAQIPQGMTATVAKLAKFLGGLPYHRHGEGVTVAGTPFTKPWDQKGTTLQYKLIKKLLDSIPERLKKKPHVSTTTKIPPNTRFILVDGATLEFYSVYDNTRKTRVKKAKLPRNTGLDGHLYTLPRPVAKTLAKLGEAKVTVFKDGLLYIKSGDLEFIAASMAKGEKPLTKV